MSTLARKVFCRRLAQKSADNLLCQENKGGIIGPVRKIFYIISCLIFFLLISTVANATVQHKIKKGETLYKIAKHYSISVREIKEVNRLNSSRIHLGDVLTIPTKSSSKSQAKTNDKNLLNGNLTTHIVKRGENLYRISLKFGIPVDELKKINNLSKNTIKAGQVLFVPTVESEEELPAATEDSATPIEMAKLNEEEEYEKEANSQIDERVAKNSETENGEKAEENWLSLMDIAMDYIGVPYRFGGSSLSGIDCSAFVQMVYRYFSIDLPRTAREQFKAGVKVSKKELRIGDLIFFRTYAKYPSHVGIYIGEGKMIHASSRNKKVTITSIKEPYYARRYIGAVRLPEITTDISTGNITENIKLYN